MSDPAKNTARFRKWAECEGASLFGTAEISGLKSRFLLSESEIAGLDHAVSIGIRLSRAVLEGVHDKPTLLYKWHYQQANQFLDKLAFRLARLIEDDGGLAIPVPASQVVDWQAKKGHVSHRFIGEAAGLGWRGRNNLLVHPKMGSQIRLVTVLTNIPLLSAAPLQNGCGECAKCVGVCPAGALGETAGDYDLQKCHDLLERFSKERGIGVHICGLCVKACDGVRDGKS
jgi:epoxyqueuosine reductase QueG